MAPRCVACTWVCLTLNNMIFDPKASVNVFYMRSKVNALYRSVRTKKSIRVFLLKGFLLSYFWTWRVIWYGLLKRRVHFIKMWFETIGKDQLKMWVWKWCDDEQCLWIHWRLLLDSFVCVTTGSQSFGLSYHDLCPFFSLQLHHYRESLCGLTIKEVRKSGEKIFKGSLIAAKIPLENEGRADKHGTKSPYNQQGYIHVSI